MNSAEFGMSVQKLICDEFNVIPNDWAKKQYDSNYEEPVIRCSICTGEQVAGFLNLSTGKFEEVMLIRTSQDLENFQNEYGITGTIKKIY